MCRHVQINQEIGRRVEKTGNQASQAQKPAAGSGRGAVGLRIRALSGLVVLLIGVLNFVLQPNHFQIADAAATEIIAAQPQQFRADIIEDIIDIIEKLINPPPDDDEEPNP